MKFKLFNWLRPLLLSIFLVAIIGACVPTVSELYTGPEATGQIIQLSDFSPVVNAKVSYGDTSAPSQDNNVVVSDSSGVFTLPPNTYLTPEILMPANMAKTTSVHVFSNPLLHSRFVVRFQDKMYTKKDMGTLILDDNSEDYEPSLSADGIDLSDLNQSLLAEHLFAGCNKEEGLSAIQRLNISRKLARQLEHLKTTNNVSRIELTQNYLDDSLEQTQLMWEFFIYQCENKKPSEQLRAVYFQVLQELDSLR